MIIRTHGKGDDVFMMQSKGANVSQSNLLGDLCRTHFNFDHLCHRHFHVVTFRVTHI